MSGGWTDTALDASCLVGRGGICTENVFARVLNVKESIGIFEASKLALAIIAHVNVVQALKGQQQLDEAKTLASRGYTDIPEPLKDAVNELAERAKDLDEGAEPSSKRVRKKTNGRRGVGTK